MEEEKRRGQKEEDIYSSEVELALVDIAALESDGALAMHATDIPIAFIRLNRVVAAAHIQAVLSELYRKKQVDK